jgi:hypothetical protein
LLSGFVVFGQNIVSVVADVAAGQGRAQRRSRQRGLTLFEVSILLSLVLALGIGLRATLGSSLVDVTGCSAARLSSFVGQRGLPPGACAVASPAGLFGKTTSGSPVPVWQPASSPSPEGSGPGARRRSAGAMIAELTPETAATDAPAAADGVNSAKPAPRRGSGDPLMERHLIDNSGMVITNDPSRARMGLGHLSNVGTCPLIILARDQNGAEIDEINPLLPGQIIETYVPPPETHTLAVELMVNLDEYPCEPGKPSRPGDVGTLEFDRVQPPAPSDLP